MYEAPTHLPLAFVLIAMSRNVLLSFFNFFFPQSFLRSKIGIDRHTVLIQTGNKVNCKGKTKKEKENYLMQ